MQSIWARIAAQLAPITGSARQLLTLDNVLINGASISPGVPNFAPTALVQAANVPINLALGSYFLLTLTTNAVHTIDIPTNVTGPAIVTIAIANASGGAAGAATFTGGAGGYRLAGAWVQAATANLRSVTFRRDPVGLWREIARNAADQLIA
jgi:hypothetical protein